MFREDFVFQKNGCLGVDAGRFFLLDVSVEDLDFLFFFIIVIWVWKILCWLDVVKVVIVKLKLFIVC